MHTHTGTHSSSLSHLRQSCCLNCVSLSMRHTFYTHIPHCRAPHAHNSDVFSISLSRVYVCVRTHSFTVTNGPPGQRSWTTSGFYTQSLSVIGNSHCCRHCRGSWDTTQVLSNPTLQAFMISFVSLTECTCPRRCMQQAEGWVRLL